jgi:hypothetical protein
MRTSSRGGLGTLVVALAVLAGGEKLSAQTGDDARWSDDCHHRSWSGRRERYCEVRIQRLDVGTPALTVDGRENGGIEVAGSNGDSIVVHEIIETEARTQDEAREIASQIRVITTGNAIRAEGPTSPYHGSWSVNYRILAPKRIDLTLTTTNGPLEVDGVTGRMELHAVNGPIGLSQVGGDIHARAQNGPLEVSLDGKRWDGAGLDAETENGPVDLTLPAQYAAHLETSTVNGALEIDFPITLQGRIDPRRIAMDVGGGGPPVRVVTTNGPVVIRKE